MNLRKGVVIINSGHRAGKEKVAQWCFVRKVFLKFRKIHRKIPVPEPLFQ